MEIIFRSQQAKIFVKQPVHLQNLDGHQEQTTYFKKWLPVREGIRCGEYGSCTPGIFNSLLKKGNREQKNFLLAHRRSHRKVPYSADWEDTVCHKMGRFENGKKIINSMKTSG